MARVEKQNVLLPGAGIPNDPSVGLSPGSGFIRYQASRGKTAFAGSQQGAVGAKHPSPQAFADRGVKELVA